MEDIAARIEREVGSWPGVSVHPHRFGGREFRLGRRELGHLHGDRWADLPFKRTIRDMLVETARAQPHHVLPDSGWVSKQIRDDADVAEVIELFRLSYERAQVAAQVREAQDG
jgi:Luciferase